MKRLFLAERLKIFIALFVLFPLAAVFFSSLEGGYSHWQLIFPLAAVITAVILLQSMKMPFYVMKRTEQVLEEMLQEMANMSGNFNEFAQKAQTTYTSVNFAHDISYASLVKVDHMIYKQKAYKTFHAGTENDDAHAVKVDHHSCRLGKWYYEGDGQATFGNLQSFKELEQPHSEVHSAGHAALDLLSQEWEKDKILLDKILENYRHMEEASNRVMDRIDAMITEKHG